VAAFYIDHDVANEVGRLLRGDGHDVVTVRELGTTRAGDDEHLLAAAQAGRTLLSHNRKDFLLLHGAWQRWSQAWSAASTHSGILLLPQMRPLDAVDALADLLRSAEPLENALFEYRSQRWTRRP